MPGRGTGDVDEKLLNVKYASSRPPKRIDIEDRNVFIVEGGDEASVERFMKFVESAQ